MEHWVKMDQYRALLLALKMCSPDGDNVYMTYMYDAYTHIHPHKHDALFTNVY